MSTTGSLLNKKLCLGRGRYHFARTIPSKNKVTQYIVPIMLLKSMKIVLDDITAVISLQILQQYYCMGEKQIIDKLESFIKYHTTD